MKLDEIIEELQTRSEAYNRIDWPPNVKKLYELVLELAQHVKAQEPEELTEEEMEAEREYYAEKVGDAYGSKE